jgi:phosphoribosyl 1,2-cyclic phosphodiesterase
MRIFVLGSGSSGNCLVVQADGERLVLEAGMGPLRARARMQGLGADLISARVPLGILVTHEHADHSAHAVPLARALKAPLMVHERMRLPARPSEPTRRRPVEARPYTPGRPFGLGPFLVEALPVPHDAPHVALRVTAGSQCFALVTDVGRITRDLRRFLESCDLVLLEANYCPMLLEGGPYPPHLKRRVAGPLGHLANAQAADLAASLEDSRVSRVVLVHLSRANNTPERALESVTSSVRRLSVEVLPHGASRAFDVRRKPGARGEQLAFGFGSAHGNVLRGSGHG